MNKSVAKNMAIIVSSILGKIFLSKKFFVIQQIAAAINTKLTTFCSYVKLPNPCLNFEISSLPPIKLISLKEKAILNRLFAKLGIDV